MPDDEPKRGRGRPRTAGTEEALLQATMALLRERGYAALTVEDVAARAGVAKTTLYRRWSSKGSLVAAAIAASTGARSAGDLSGFARQTRSLFAGELGPTLAILAGEAESDAELRERLVALILPPPATLIGVSAAATIAAVLWFEQLLRAKDVDDVTLDRLVEMASRIS